MYLHPFFIYLRMSLIKIFTGSEIIATAIKAELEAYGIMTILKNEIQAAAMVGYWSPYLGVEVLVHKKDVMQAKLLVEKIINNE